MATSLHTSVPITLGSAGILGAALVESVSPGIGTGTWAVLAACVVAYGRAQAIEFARPDSDDGTISTLVGAVLLGVSALVWRHASLAFPAVCALGAATMLLTQFAFRGRMKRWPAAGPSRLDRYHEDSRALSFSPDGTRLASASLGQVSVWNLQTGARELLLDAHVFDAFAVSFSSDGRVLATGGWDHDPPWPHGEHDTFDVKLWNAVDGQLITRLSGHTESIAALAVSADGRFVASGSVDRTVRVRNLEKRELHVTLIGHRDPIHSVAFGPDSQLVSACTKEIRLWSADSGAVARVIAWPSTAIALSRDGRLIAAGDEHGVVTIFDAASGNRVATCPSIKGWISALAFTPDGAAIAGGALTGTLYEWEAKTGRVLRRFRLRHWERINSVEISHDGRSVASAAGDGIVVRRWPA